MAFARDNDDDDDGGGERASKRSSADMADIRQYYTLGLDYADDDENEEETDNDMKAAPSSKVNITSSPFNEQKSSAPKGMSLADELLLANDPLESKGGGYVNKLFLDEVEEIAADHEENREEVERTFAADVVIRTEPGPVDPGGQWRRPLQQRSGRRLVLQKLSGGGAAGWGDGELLPQCGRRSCCVIS